MALSQLKNGALGSHIFLALDKLNLQQAGQIASELAPFVAGGKANDLILETGAACLDNMGFAFRFLDPKLKDIGNTVKNGLLKMRGHADIVTVHADMAERKLREIAEVGRECGIAVVGVTFLTDEDEAECKETYLRTPSFMVKKLTLRAKAAGLAGIVCSTQEVRRARDLFPEGIIISPGTRSKGSATHDQARTGTHYQAARDGSDIIIGGRQILEKATASERVAEAKRINEEFKQGQCDQ